MKKQTHPLILIVDDQQMNIDVAMKFLGNGYQYLTVQSAEEAETVILKNREISLILLDLVLPGMSGIALMEKRKELGILEIPIIIMTADHDTKTEIKGLQLGASDFIVKPLVADILRNRVENVLSRQRETIYETMLYKAEHDDLTGLYNRKKMFAETRAMILGNPERKFAFVRYDIDQFSLYNSAMGEEEGNKLLLTIADTLREMAKEYENCVYGRIDADVFCFCGEFDRATIEKQIENANQLLENYREDYRLEASFGIYLIENPNTSMENIYTSASLAANKCKNLYDVHYAFYEEWMGETLREQQEIKNEMVTALEEGQFIPYLQPKYDLESDVPCGAEALVRWKHPIKGLVSPGQFIPVFEQNGFVAKLDYYMWESICQILQRWKNEGKRIYPISVNISRISMYNPQLDVVLTELVKKYELEPRLLELEITESAYMSNTDLMKYSIEKLQQAGFTILMDDFGSGYSSLNTLKDIHVDVLKVDIKFLPNGTDNERSEKILSSVIRMAGWIGMPVIAEGVETEEQRNYLRDIGCEYVQGFYYAKPMLVSEYEELVAKGDKVLEKKEKSVFSSAVWSSDQKINEIMTAIELPIAIVEHSSVHTQIVRANSYHIKKYGKGLPGGMDDFSRDCLRVCMEEAEEKGIAETEIKCMIEDGDMRLVNVKMKCIEKNSKASLLCSVSIDITNERKYEAQLRKLSRMLPTGERTKMLIADDSKISREMLGVLFSDRFDILYAEDGIEALSILKREKDRIAVILLDLHMPNMDGKDFLTAKNKQNYADDIPVIIISSDAALEVQYDMLAMGVMDYYSKPYNPKILKSKVNNAIMYAERYHNLRTEFANAIKNTD